MLTGFKRSKFVWPISDKGLAKRMHGIVAPTLVIWGKSAETPGRRRPR